MLGTLTPVSGDWFSGLEVSDSSLEAGWLRALRPESLGDSRGCLLRLPKLRGVGNKDYESQGAEGP